MNGGWSTAALVGITAGVPFMTGIVNRALVNSTLRTFGGHRIEILPVLFRHTAA